MKLAIASTLLLLASPASAAPLTNRKLKQAALDYCNGGDARDAVINTYGELGDWDVSQVTSMKSVFDSENTDPIFKSCDLSAVSSWDVSSVTTMEHLFDSLPDFDADLSSWDVRSVQDFSWMFTSNKQFSGKGLDLWNTSSATNMGYMFAMTTNFNADISGFIVDNVRDFRYMLDETTLFNQDISQWNVSQGTNAGFTWFLCNSTAFNNNLCDEGADPSWVGEDTYCENGAIPVDPCPWGAKNVA